MSRLSYKTLFIILFLLLIPIAFLLKIDQKNKSVYAAWWSDSWMYRQSINISSHTSAESNVYITTTINIGSTSKAQPDDGDFRFLDLSGNLLPYYIVSGTNTTAITFHIQLTSFPVGAQTIYAYYGNSSASNGFSSSDFSTAASNYTIGSLGTEETGGAPVAWWKFDEGVGTTAYDSSANKNNGVLGTGTSAPIWADNSQCITGNCLSFNGSTNYVDSNYVYHLNYNNSSTFSFWFKPISNNTGGKVKNILGENSYEMMIGQIDNLLTFHQWNAAGSDLIYLNTSNFIQPNTWYFINVIYDSSNHQAKIYINGVLNGSQTATNDVFINRTESLKIGRAYGWNSSTSPFLNGYLDDVKIYSYARSATQIAQDYATGKSGQSTSKGSNTSFGSSSSNSLSNGLVGYWKFDEGTATTVIDYSGYNQNLGIRYKSTINPTGPWGPGKFGTAYQDAGYEYPNDESAAGNWLAPTQTDFTISVWVKPSSTAPATSGYIVSRWWGDCNTTYQPGWAMQYITSTHKLNFRIAGDSCGPDATLSSGSSLPPDTWSNVIFTHKTGEYIRIYINGKPDATMAYTQGLNPTPPRISFGCGANNNDCGYPGLTDEARVYNRVLSDQEITQLYNYVPGPVAYWKMDEGVGTTAYDSSGNGYNSIFATGTSAPTWSTGKIGKALTFNRNRINTTANITPNINSPVLTFNAWLKFNNLSGIQRFITSNNGRIETGLSSTTFFIHSVNSAGTDWNVGNTVLPTSCQTGWHYITVIRDSTVSSNNVKAYCDGIQFTSGNFTNGLNGIYNLYSITLGYGITEQSFDGQMDDVKIYNYARTPEQILQDMQGNSSQSSAESGQPLVWYKFDEGQGSVANNSGIGGAGFNGTISGSLWSSGGKNNKALNFTSTSANKITTNYKYDDKSTYTLSAWIYPTLNGGSQWRVIVGTIYGNNINAGLVIAGNNICYHDYITSNDTQYCSSSNPIVLNQWQHVALSYQSGNINVYYNGSLVKNINATKTDDTSNNAIIGGPGTDSYSGGRYFDGLLDDVKIYNYALSSDEIKKDYNQSSSVVFGMSNMTVGGTAVSATYCVPGSTDPCSPPVAEWKFDEGVGTTAYDTSGNNNNGVLSGSTLPTWTNGKIGTALNFNGVNNYVDSGTSPTFEITNEKTIEFWMKPETTQIANYARPLSFGGYAAKGWSIYTGTIGQTSLSFNFGSDSGWSGLFAPSVSYQPNQWNFVSVVVKLGQYGTSYLNGKNIGSTLVPATYYSGTANKMYIGTGQGFFKGSIDQVRIYNYARTPAQVAWDYNNGKPVGWWKMDECQGTAIGDWSGNNNTGTLNIGASGTQNSVGTCQTSGTAWGNGATGKWNSSLNFDSYDDIITVPSNSGTILNPLNYISLSAWIYINNSKSNGYFVAKGWGDTYNLSLNSSNKVTFEIVHDPNASDWINLISNTALVNQTWNHIVGVYDSQYLYLYINGKLDNKTAYAKTMYQTSQKFAIGGIPHMLSAYYGNGIDGKVDDVRIYNYPLTQEQIKQIYNGGAVSFN